MFISFVTVHFKCTGALSMVQFFYLKNVFYWDLPGGLVVKNLPCSAGDTGLIPSRGTKIP